ncbi:MAG: SDR family oxidoreductase [Spirochaetes bacterium]|nr:SDR family oxidoreductase [Spirochaetota bacterium]
MQRETALITGATSGIGRAYAERFARMGYDLVITGRRKRVIDEAARAIRKNHGVSVKVVIAEFTAEAGVRAVLDAIRREKNLAVLVNNAGYGIDGLFADLPIGDHLDMVKVHVTAALRFIHAVLPGMIERKKGAIINVSSLGAFAPSPINGIYGGSKSFLNVFTESLHLETRRHGIRVQALCPGFTVTDFHNKMGVEEEVRGNRMIHWMNPEKVVEISMRCLEKGKVICIPGLRNRFLRALIAVVPRRFYYRVAEGNIRR